MLYYVDEYGFVTDVTGCNQLMVGHSEVGEFQCDVVLVSY